MHRPVLLLFFALPLVLFQVRGGQQGLFSCSADARCPGKGVGHVGWLSRKHLCKGPPTPLRSLSHYLLPPCLSPSEREQVPQISSQGEYESAQGTHFSESNAYNVKNKEWQLLKFCSDRIGDQCRISSMSTANPCFVFFNVWCLMCWMGPGHRGISAPWPHPAHYYWCCKREEFLFPLLDTVTVAHTEQ